MYLRVYQYIDFTLNVLFFKELINSILGALGGSRTKSDTIPPEKNLNSNFFSHKKLLVIIIENCIKFTY